MTLYTKKEQQLIKEFILKLDRLHPNWSCNQMLSQLSDWTGFKKDETTLHNQELEDATEYENPWGD